MIAHRALLGSIGMKVWDALLSGSPRAVDHEGEVAEEEDGGWQVVGIGAIQVPFHEEGSSAGRHVDGEAIHDPEFVFFVGDSLEVIVDIVGVGVPEEHQCFWGGGGCWLGCFWWEGFLGEGCKEQGGQSRGEQEANRKVHDSCGFCVSKSC